MLHPCQFDWKCHGWNEGDPDAEENLWAWISRKATNSRRARFSWRGAPNTPSGTQNVWAQSGRLGIPSRYQQLRALCSAVLDRWWRCKKPTSSSYSRNPGRFWSCWDGECRSGYIVACGRFDYNGGNRNLGTISLVVYYHDGHHHSASTSSSRGGGNCKRRCSAWWTCFCGRWFWYTEKAPASQSSDRRAGSSVDQKPIHSSNHGFLVQLGWTCARAWRCLAPMESKAGCWSYVMWDKPCHVWRIEPGNSWGYVTHVEEIRTHSGGPDVECLSWRCFGFWRPAFEKGRHTRSRTWRWLPLQDLPRSTLQRSLAALWALGNLWSVLSAASWSWAWEALRLPRLPGTGWTGGKRWEYLTGIWITSRSTSRFCLKNILRGWWSGVSSHSHSALQRHSDIEIIYSARTDPYLCCHSWSFQSESITSANQTRWKQVQRAET